VVEDRAVEREMNRFGEALLQFKGPVTTESLSCLKHLSFDLSHAIRESLNKTWPIPRGDIRIIGPSPCTEPVIPAG
jgi:hypothetical protein